jgi:hypothetical protein
MMSMSEPDVLDEPAPPPRKRRHRLLGCSVVLLLLFGACGGFYGILIYQSNRDLREAEAEADRQDPAGWRLAQIEEQRKVLKDEDNAALVVQDIKKNLPVQWPQPRRGGVAGQPVYVENDLSSLPPEVQLDAALLRDLRKDLEAAKKALPAAHRLAKLRDGRFPLQWSQDIISTTIASQDARAAANLLRAEAVLLAQEGKADQALEATRGILVAGRSVGDEPLFISMLIRISGATMAVQTLERVLAQGEPSVPELKRMQELLEAEVAEPLLLTAARGERASMHEMIHAMRSGHLKLSGVAGGGSPAVIDLAGSTLARRSHPHILRLMNEYVEIAKLPPQDQGEPLKAVEQKVKQAKADYDIVTALVMPAMIKAGEASRRNQAYLRCAIVAVAAERFRQEQHRWPTTLAELVPNYLSAVPTDPYDGQPLRFKAAPDGLLIYSVGPDRQDDGGARNRINPNAKGTDYVFRLWDVERRRQPAAEVLPPPDERFAP